MEDDNKYFYCFHCRHYVFHSAYEVQMMRKHVKEMGALWWTCRVCGKKTYFEDVHVISNSVFQLENNYITENAII